MTDSRPKPTPGSAATRRGWLFGWLAPSRERLGNYSLFQASLGPLAGNIFFAGLSYAQVAMVAMVIGISRQYDLYLLAWMLPELSLFAFGNILQMHVVPSLHRLEYNQGQEQYWRGVWALLIWAGGGMLLCLLLAGWAARPILSLVTPTMSPAEQAQGVLYFRLLLITAAAMGLVKLLGNLHRAGHLLWLNAVAQVAVPLAVLATLWLRPAWGVWGLWAGVTIGAVIQVLLLVPAPVRWGLMRHRPTWRHPLISDLGRNLIYLLFITVGLRLLLAGDRVLASTLEAGTVSVLRYALLIVLSGLSLVVMPLLGVFFNRLSHLASRARWDECSELLLRAVETFWLPLLPLSVFIFVFAEPLVSIVLGRGAFDQTNMADTARVLRGFAFLLPLAGWYFIALAAHTTRRSYLWPFGLAVLFPLLNLVLGFLLAPAFGMIGVAVVTLSCLLLWTLLLLKGPVAPAGRDRLVRLGRDLAKAVAGPLLAVLVVESLRAGLPGAQGLWAQVGLMALFVGIAGGVMFSFNRRRLSDSLAFLRQCKVAQ